MVADGEHILVTNKNEKKYRDEWKKTGRLLPNGDTKQANKKKHPLE